MNLKNLAYLMLLCVGLTPPLPGQQSTTTTQATTNSTTPAQHAAALKALLKRQATIQKLLPHLEKVTVCLQTDGGSGSGVIVNKEGLVLTAAHVVGEHKEMVVRFADGRTAKGKVLGVFNPADAAMLQIVEGGPYPFVDVAGPKTLNVGQSVFALGHPSGFDQQRGIPLRVGHVVRDNGDLFASDCALIGGDSGGPTFNLKGQVVGIHSNITGDLATNNDVAMEPFHKYWDRMLKGERIGGKLFEPLREGQKKAPAAPQKTKPAAKQQSQKKAPPATRPSGGSDKPAGSNQRDRADRATKRTPVFFSPQSSGKPNPTQQQTKQADPAKEEKPPTELQLLLKEARDSKGRLKVDRVRLRKLRDKLNKRLEAFAPVGGRLRDAWGTEYLHAFAPQIERYSASVYPVIVGGRKMATAMVVHEAGYLVTKASEVEGRKVTLRIKDDLIVPAEIVRIERDLDIAVLKLSDQDLQLVPVDLSNNSSQAADFGAGKGVLCCAVGTHKTLAAGFGVVSVAARALNGNTSAYLGVEQMAADDGVRLDRLRPNGPAARAGLKPGDVVEAFDDQKCADAATLTRLVESRLPNAKVTLSIRRGDSWLTLPVQLGDKSKVAAMPGAREQGTDGLSTKMSRRRWNFTLGIQHDTAILPRDCGGPLVDLDGNLLGINIARAGRIKSYALPVPLVAEFVNQVLTGQGKDVK